VFSGETNRKRDGGIFPFDSVDSVTQNTSARILISLESFNESLINEITHLRFLLTLLMSVIP
jgi:hypothetical protein